MKNKYAELINQLDRVTETYEHALAAVKALEATAGEQPDVLGVTGAVGYFGDDFEKNRAIHVRPEYFVQAAIDCGSGFKMEDRDDYTRFECSMFGYRVFSLLFGDDRGYAELKEKVGADE